MRDPIAAILTVNGKVDRGLSRGTDRRELDFRGTVVVVVVVLFNEIEIEKFSGTRFYKEILNDFLSKSGRR